MGRDIRDRILSCCVGLKVVIACGAAFIVWALSGYFTCFSSPPLCQMVTCQVSLLLVMNIMEWWEVILVSLFEMLVLCAVKLLVYRRFVHFVDQDFSLRSTI